MIYRINQTDYTLDDVQALLGERNSARRWAQAWKQVARRRGWWRRLYQSAAHGRREFRKALRTERSIVAEQQQQIAGLLGLLESHPALTWLRAHGQHPPACAALHGQPCDCGLDRLR